MISSLMILAAASLTDVIPPVVREWKKAHPDVEVKLSFDASSRLAAQIEQGIPADVFISADSDWMNQLESKNKLDSGTRIDLLGNEIVAIVPTDASVPKSASDLKDPQYKKIALAGENVPISKYAKAAFESLKVWGDLKSKVVRGENVRTSLNWIGEKEVDAGVVYRTDATGNRKVKIAFAFPKDSYPAVVYPGAVLGATTSKEVARSFLEFCRGKGAREIFRKAGFTEPGASGKK